MIGQKSFIIHVEWVKAIESFHDDLQFELYKAIMSYGFTGEVPELSASASIAFSFIKVKMDENKQLYKEKCEQLKENARKGGAPRGNKNATKTTISGKNNQNNHFERKTTKTTISGKNNLDNDNDNDNELLDNSIELSNKEEKNKNINIFIKKESEKADFDTRFRKLATPICNGTECEIWRDLMSKKYGIQNWEQAVIDFKNHIIEHSKEESVLRFATHEELKSYMANALKIKDRNGCNFLSEASKRKHPQSKAQYPYAMEQDPSKWREPCKRLPNIVVEYLGKKIPVGVVLQDGKEHYCSPDLPEPPDRFHFYNPFTELYDNAKDSRRQQDIDIVPEGIKQLEKDFYLKRHENDTKENQLVF